MVKIGIIILLFLCSISCKQPAYTPHFEIPVHNIELINNFSEVSIQEDSGILSITNISQDIIIKLIYIIEMAYGEEDSFERIIVINKAFVPDQILIVESLQDTRILSCTINEVMVYAGN